MLVEVSTLKFPSDKAFTLDWEAVKKERKLTDHDHSQFKSSTLYIEVCPLQNDEWGDTCYYGVNGEFIWQDTQNGLPGWNKDNVLSLADKVLNFARNEVKEGCLEMGGSQIRWRVTKVC